MNFWISGDAYRGVSFMVFVFALGAPTFAAVTVEEADGVITVNEASRPVLRYRAVTVEPPAGQDSVYARSGFIHPIYSPSGKVLTDPFPVGHVHQHALFSAWTKATFRNEVVDFWNQQERLGDAEHVATEEITSDGFRVRLRQISLKNGPAILEQWRVKVQPSSNTFVIDLEIEQRCATADEVYLHPYHYGGLGLRGSAAWNSADEPKFEGPMQILTGDGLTARDAANHTRPRWLAAYGPVGGTPAGLVIMDHPMNFRYPQPVRVHPIMPYFVFSPVVEGSFVLTPGIVYRTRYRIVTFDGFPSKETIETWFASFVATD